MMKKIDTEKYHVPSLERALDILEYLAQLSLPVSLSTIAKNLDKSASELFRIVNCLVKRKYIVRDQTVNAYSLSLKFFELANSIPPFQRLVDASVVPLIELVRDIRYSCHLSVLEGGDLVILYEQEGLEAINVHVKPGSRIPASHTTSGRLLLSTLTEDILNSVLMQDSFYLQASKDEKAAIHQEIESLRGKDSIVSPSKQHPGVYDIVSIVSISRNLYSALAAPIFQFNDNDMEFADLQKKVAGAAEKIRKTIGFD